jgi:hypothetical protein
MLTFLDVLDDAVKIGLGGFIGWLISRGTRSHDFEKERRRRKQDCLERVVEDLDEAESSVDALAVSVVSQTEIDKTSDALGYSLQLQMTNERLDANRAAEVKLYRSRSKLVVFGFTRCSEALEAYHAEFLSYRAFLGQRLTEGTTTIENQLSEREKLLTCVQQIRDSVTAAFSTL